MKKLALGFAVLLTIWSFHDSWADDDSATPAEGPKVRITIAKDGETRREQRSVVATEVVDQVRREVDEALEALPDDLGEAMSEADREQLKADLSRLKQLKNKQHHDGIDLEFRHRKDSEGGSKMHFEDLMGVIAILMVFGTPIVIVAIVSYNSRRKREMVHRTIDRIIDSGQPVPTELLDALDKGLGSGANSLRRALVNIALGSALVIFMWNVAGDEVATLGLIPLFIGVAYLVIWWLERGKENAARI